VAVPLLAEQEPPRPVVLEEGPVEAGLVNQPSIVVIELQVDRGDVTVGISDRERRECLTLRNTPQRVALTDRARADLGAGADRDRVAEWLDGQVDPAGTNAARFLSTVPSVADPTATARQYLVAGVTTWLAVEALADGVEDASSPASLKRSIRRVGVPSVEELSELGEHGRLYAGNFALAAVASRSGLEVGSMPVDHLSMGVPTEIDLERFRNIRYP